MPGRLRIVLPDMDYTAEYRDGGIRLEHAGEFRIRVAAHGRYLVNGPDGEFVVSAAGAGDRLWATCDGQVLEIRVQPASSRGHARGGEHDVLGPPMPASVVRVHVKSGDAVQSGDVLVSLEAMKMELPIRAPRDGIVGAIHCREGELVQPGTTLVELQ